MADGTIDNLSIQIGASSNTAVQEINKLASSLKDLKTTLSGIGKMQIGKSFTNSMSALAGAMKAVKSEDISKLRQVASAIKTFDGVNEIKLNPSFAQKLADVAAAADLIKEEHASKLAAFGDALKNLQGGKFSISKNLPDQLKNIGDAVSQITDETVSRLNEMTQAIARLNGINMSGFANAAKAAAKQAKSVSVAPEAVSKARDSSTVTHTSNKQMADEMMRASSQSGSSTLRDDLSHIATDLMGSIVPGAKAFSSALHTVASAAKKVLSHVVSIAKYIAKIAANKIKNLIDKSAIGSVQRLAKAFKTLTSSIGRIAFYRVIRSAIKYVTDAIKEGATNAYWFAREYGDATAYIADAFDNLSSKQFKMSNQLGAAWATMIAAIEPILIRLINLVTKAADAVTQLFALLSGKGTYMKATDYTKQWADAASGAAGAAKEWKNQLMGFDEINRLEDQNSGSGGGGSSTPDYSNMFEEVPVSDFFKEVKAAFENGQWAELGQIIGNKFNEIINSIKWDEYGEKLGNGLQAIISTSYNFLKTANFVDLGSGIATFINNAIDQVNFEEAGRLAMRLHTALWDIIYGAVITLNWSELAGKLSDYIIGALTELATWLSGLDPQAIAQAIRDFFNGIKRDEIAEAFKTVVKEAFYLALDIVDELFPDGLLPTLAKGVADFVTKIFEALSDSDFQAAHNILSYKLDKAVFGEKWANFVWGHGDYAGSEIIQGMINGVDVGTTEFENALKYDIGNNVNDVMWDVESDLSKAEDAFGEFSTNSSGALSDVVPTVEDLDAALYNMYLDGSSSVNSLDSMVCTHSWSMTDALHAVAQSAADAWSWLTNLSNIGEINLRTNQALGYDVYLQGFAAGGFPEDGLFLANHGEMVGQFSNGRTAVANNEQITAGIADAVYDAFMAAFSQTGNGSGNSQPVNIYLDGRQIAQSTTKYQNQFARASGT